MWNTIKGWFSSTPAASTTVDNVNPLAGASASTFNGIDQSVIMGLIKLIISIFSGTATGQVFGITDAPRKDAKLDEIINRLRSVGNAAIKAEQELLSKQQQPIATVKK
jgi:hypothetical protein